MKNKMKYITKFRDYNDLPFPKSIQMELFKMHNHEDFGDNKIIYYEKDVLILLQMLQDEIKNKIIKNE